MTKLALTLTAIALLAGSACGSDSATSADATPASDADTSPGTVPAESSALGGWLQAGNYESFDAEAAVHASTGPHGQVRSFFNPALAASLGAGAQSHPIGSGVVKELHSGDALSGWAVMVKTADAGAASDWYYYEVLSTDEGAAPVADGQGVSGCAGCHGSGIDYIRTSFP